MERPPLLVATSPTGWDSSGGGERGGGVAADPDARLPAKDGQCPATDAPTAAETTGAAAAAAAVGEPARTPVERGDIGWAALPWMAPATRRPLPAARTQPEGATLPVGGSPPTGRAPPGVVSRTLPPPSAPVSDEAAGIALTREILKGLLQHPSAVAAAPMRLALRGGPGATPSPPVDWVRFVLAPVLAAVGVEVAVTAAPDCGASAHTPPSAVNVDARLAGGSPRQLASVSWATPATPTGIVGRVWVAGLPRSVATRGAVTVGVAAAAAAAAAVGVAGYPAASVASPQTALAAA
ncbi:hypothetical protein I4F81_003628 [Pyropia yezoensis]|uniref:Uncharacterized protein n=1 Tax=Pyropia yezoensis TaxID=2788 RepID=A0ACC3BSV5_PYRYE|nr:hypothetical protein I4F81_003628 [Neopyropia yezoensis]